MPDHLNLIKEDIDLSKQSKRSLPFGDRQVNVKEHGKKLSENFEKKQKEFNDNKRVAEEFIIYIHRDTEMDINLENVGLKTIAEIQDKKQILAEVFDETLFNQKISDFTANKINVSRTVHYSEFANIDEFDFLTPEQKMSTRLQNIDLTNEKILVDIQLHTLEKSLKDIHENVISFKEYINENNGETIADCILDHLIIIRVKIPGVQLIEFLKHNNIFTADLPQRPIYEESVFQNISYDYLPDIIGPEKDAPNITVIDSGVLSTHPLLSGSIVDSEQFGSLSHPNDEEGHGTMVAGIVQYGDVYESIRNSNKTNYLKQNFNILNARVTDKNNSFPDDTIISKSVKEAIEYFVDDSLIFNLSLGDDGTPYEQGAKMDPWSYQLDLLNHKYNLAIVVSSGNYTSPVKPDVFSKNYLYQMLDDYNFNIIPPSISVSSISVGSRVKDDVPHQKNRRSISTAIAPKNYPSPFTRLGPGYKMAIKPETVAQGGNYSLDTNLNRFDKNDKNLGVLSTSLFNKTNNSWFESRSGTSFAAPYITHLLGHIKKKIPEAKGNLLRALLLSNTKPNEELKMELSKNTKKEFTDTKLNEMAQEFEGFGGIKEFNLVYSSNNNVKMYYEGEIGVDKANIFEIPIPSEIYNSSKKATIKVSIAYNPPVKDKRIDYKGITLDFQLLRGVSKDFAVKYLCKPEKKEFETIKDIEDRFKCKMNPSVRASSRGTTIVSEHKITNNRKTSEDDYSNQYYLGIRCNRKWYKGEMPQEFAVVVTIESEEESIDIYTPIKTRVESRTRIRARQ